MLLTDTKNHTNRQAKADSRLRVLVLCTGNSARSIMAEAIFNSVGAPLFQAYSAGSRPTGRVNPLALEQISRLDLIEDSVIRSKSWDEFTKPGAPEFDLVLTVCDNAAAEACPAFSGDYQHVHWSFPDPAGSSDDVELEREAFARCFETMKARVQSLVDTLSSSSGSQSIIDAVRKLA